MTKPQKNIASAMLKGSTFRVIQTVIGIAIGFWMLPFLINNLGSADYALWVLVGSIVSSYYLMDLGLNHAVTRYVSKYIFSDEYERANQIINTAILIYSVLGIILFILTLLGAIFVAPNLIENAENLRITQAIILIVGLSISLEFPSKAFPGVIYAYMRFDTLAIIRTIALILNACAIYIFISKGYGIISLAIISLISNLATTSFYIYFCFSLLPTLKIHKKYISSKDLKEIFHFSKWTFVTDVTNLIKEKMGIWLIAGFISGGAVTTYYVAVRLTDYAIQFSTQALGFTVPIFTKYYAENKMDKLENSLFFFLKLNFIVLVLFISGFTLLGDAFISLWIKDEIDHLLAYQCLIVLAVGRLLIFMTVPFFSVLLTIKQHKYASYLSLVDTSVAGSVALYLIPKYGVIGAAISFSLLVGILRALYLPYIVRKLLKFKFRYFAARSFMFTVVSLLISYVWSLNIHNVTSWGQLACLSIMVVFTILLASFTIFSSNEKLEISSWCKSKLSKVSK
jgi:O-antigen/teichoic acid export membrane protein